MSDEQTFRFTEHERQALSYMADTFLFRWESLCGAQPTLRGRERDLRDAWEKLGPDHLWGRSVQSGDVA